MRKKKDQKTEQDATVQEEELIIKPVKETEDDGIVKGTVGYELRKAREKKKKDLQKIASQLRIRASFLEALEKSQYNAFPGQAYAFGFLRTYSDFLGLDTDTLIMRYRDERSFLKPEKIDMPIPPEKTELLPSARYLFWAVLCIAFVWAFWYFLTYSQTDTIVPHIESTTTAKPAESVPEKSVLPASADQTDESNQIEAQQKLEEETPAPSSRVKIVAKKDVWIEISDGKTLVFSKMLKKDESYDVPSDSEKLLLKTGNAGSMDVFVDGKKIKSLGSVGAVISDISLSPEKLKNR